MTDEFNPSENNYNEKSFRKYIKSEIAESNSDINESNDISDGDDSDQCVLGKGELNEDNDTEKNNKNNFKPKINIKKEVSNIIFDIKKVPKLGRSRKTTLRKGKHNKLSQDNIIRRFKVKLINNIYEYINSLFNINNYGKSKKPIIILKKVNPSITRSISKQDNIDWLNTTLKFFFSNNVSIKFSNYSYDYNEKLITRIYEKKQEKKVISILDQKIKDMLYIYSTDDIYQMYPGFKTLKDDIETFKKQGESNLYIQMFMLIAQNFEKTINNLIPRKKRKN